MSSPPSILIVLIVHTSRVGGADHALRVIVFNARSWPRPVA